MHGTGCNHSCPNGEPRWLQKDQRARYGPAGFRVVLTQIHIATAGLSNVEGIGFGK
jgi:hypothetical protein